MSLLFNLVANLSVEEESDHKDARFFSSSPKKQTPYMVLEGDKVGESSEAENIIMSFKLFDLSKEEIIQVIHKSFPKLLYEESRVIGSSRGWIAFMSKHDGTVHLSDVFNLGSLRVITLPPLPDPMYHPSTAIINVSLSYPPDQEDDYAMYIKFLCSEIYYCRPNHHSQWVLCDSNEIHTTASDIVYSPRNQMLFLVIMGASFLLSFEASLYSNSHVLIFCINSALFMKYLLTYISSAPCVECTPPIGIGLRSGAGSKSNDLLPIPFSTVEHVSLYGTEMEEIPTVG
ncbi:hypothetical protein ARALYDRAFT_357627 [Arabidopsis lyrata subsp. lyrata]|uniref:KIB1-4 beta-propeller domain-containing protein n=1 Tax=Arabidopsis lyrata subsp. lyrata TaxID=81972 RepID=D7MTJ6_ARALL|nr:hypothetical protein ARALYDRAFT_357627 [Arabidopsis lyrata subsp. lyrata]